MSVGSDLETGELRREIERLRAENERLTRLLKLTDAEAGPSPEQAAAALGHHGLVTLHGSSAEAKIGIFVDRFRARSDVYALRWENSRTGRSGWSPAVAGGWRRGMDRRSARPLPLTSEVVGAHLRGDVFLGLYPLQRDNTCHFVAADFDGPAAMLDALAYTKAARAVGVPAALEISQSGKGAHVWILFTEAIPAATARAVGTALIHEAIVLRGSMDLGSYDRLFPNQDVMPDGGFGNLIAAPLNGKRRQDGLTLFLDLVTLEPYADQWLFLSTLDRLSPGDAARVARKTRATTVGTEVTSLRRSTATRVHPRLPAVVHAELGAGLSVATDQLTPAALATLKHAASMANPKFYELQRLRKSIWNVPRFVRGYDLTLDGKLVLPRGLRHLIGDIVIRAGSRLHVDDARAPGEEIDVGFTADLRGPQEAAVSAMLAHDDGILVAPPGAGKTVMACAVIAERAASTIILVDRKALAEQWRERIEQFLGVRPGQLGGGRSKLTGIIDIAMLPSLARRDDIAELLGEYGHVVVDECHHIAAAAYDHSVKKVGARFWLGLTATPVRRDGLGELMTWQLGPIRHTVTGEERGTLADALAPDGVPQRMLHIHETGFSADDLDLDQPGALAVIHSTLATDRVRNAQILDDVDAALQTGRNCLVLTRRRAHLDALAALAHERGRRPLVLQGGMPVNERKAVVEQLSEAAPGDGVLVIGTAPFVGEGFDAPALDTLFLAAPISFDGLLIQCAGRVVRSAPGKDRAEVHDYHDVKTPILAASLPRRMPGYRALGFTQ